MKNLFKSIKRAFTRTFKNEASETQNTVNFSANSDPISPGQEETEQDIGKKVFERTGHRKEGVGQSSTLIPQETPVKTNQGDKNRRPHYKKYQKYKKRNGSNLKRDTSKNDLPH